MFFRLQTTAPVLFWMVLVMGAVLGASQGYRADSAANTTVDINETDATKNISSADVEGDGLSAVSSKATLDYAESQAVTALVTAETVANTVGPFVYANRSWLRPWLLQPLLQLAAIAPVGWVGLSVLGRVRDAI